MSNPYQRAGTRFQELKNQVRMQIDRATNEAIAHCNSGETGLQQVVQAEMKEMVAMLRDAADRVEKKMQEAR